MKLEKMNFLRRFLISTLPLIFLSGCVQYASIEVVADISRYKDRVAVLDELHNLIENEGYQLISNQNNNLADLKNGDKYYSDSNWLKVDEKLGYVYAGFANIKNPAYAIGLRYNQEEAKLKLTFYDTVNPEGRFTLEGRVLAEKWLVTIRDYFPSGVIKKVRKIGW